MLIVSELNYLLSKKVPAEIFTEEEKAIIYYDKTDTIPATAFAWLIRLNDKVSLVPYSDIGGKDNISFAVGGYMVCSKTGTAVIVGAFDGTESRNIKIGDREGRVYTTPSFENILSLEKGQASTNMTPAKTVNTGSEYTDKLISLIPPKIVPAGMDIASFAHILDCSIAKAKGNTNEMLRYIEENFGNGITGNIQNLLSSGAFAGIEEHILRK